MARFWSIFAAVFVLDRATKAWALTGLALGQRVVVWAGVLEWRLTHNQGIALGFLAGARWALLLLPVVAVAAGWLLLRRYRPTPYTRVATALVAGGFLGNMADRVALGFVPDMVFFPWMPWYICNAADIAITVGIALLAISLLFREGDWMLKTEGASHGTDHLDGPA